jgi:glutathione S-transferase
MATYKLYYFNTRGRAEIARLILAAAGQKFDDIRYNHDEWELHKSEMPLGQLPVLEIDGFKLPQSLTIARFLAKQFHLAGKNNLEQAQADAVVDTIGDATAKVVSILHEQDQEKKKILEEKFYNEELPKLLDHLEILFKTSSNGDLYFVGNNLTWADLHFYNASQSMLLRDPNILDKYPLLKHNRDQVEANSNVVSYLKSRPQTL